MYESLASRQERLVNPLNSFRSIFGILAALLVQLSVVAPYVSAAKMPCAATGEAKCHCCKAMDSCPCMKTGGSTKAPLPSALPDKEMKQLAANPTGNVAIPIPISPAVEPKAPAPDIGLVDHFAAVPRAVVFCSFVI